jgi:hypothetical protein
MNPIRTAQIEKLLLDTPEAYYWMGFLIADGTFYSKALKLELAEKDLNHLNEFKRFICYCGKALTCSINVMHSVHIPCLRIKFGIKNRKTYNPPDLSLFNGHLLFSLIIGIIDGDGSMGMRNGSVYNIAIKMHGSWLDQLQYILDFLYNYFEYSPPTHQRPVVKLNGAGYARLIISDRYLIAKIKQQAINLCLPIMDRKWCKIDQSYQGRIRENELLEKTAKKLKEEGLKLKDISEKMNLPLYKVKYLCYRTEIIEREYS